MRKVLRWLGRGVLALLILLVVAIGIAYALSERTLRTTHDVQGTPIAVPTDSVAIATGARLARIYGCYNGCHGSEAEGQVFMDDFLFGSAKAPDLTRKVRTLSDAELERVIRHGVRTNGESVLIMPSPMFYNLTDEDLGSIIAFLRSLPPSDGPETSLKLGPLARTLLATGTFKTAAVEIDHDAPRIDPGDRTDPVATGRYLAMTACAECHGVDLHGDDGPMGSTPNLAIVAAYTPEQFRTLMREGVPRDGRDIGLMGEMGRKRFVHFTDEERTALYTYLHEGL